MLYPTEGLLKQILGKKKKSTTVQRLELHIDSLIWSLCSLSPYGPIHEENQGLNMFNSKVIFSI